ncbi:MAG: ClbS/DfsB family four-helix bundle protein [Pseudomonadota bacterium]
MAATNKAELLAITLKEYDALSKLIGPLAASVATKANDEGVSIKDIVAHRAHWIDLFLGWYMDGQAGKTVHFPAEGYKWNELKRYNADLRVRQVDMDWSDAQAALHKGFLKLKAFVEECPEDKLYGGPMKGANNAWTPGRWAEAAGPSHFRSASKFIRTTLRTAG